jgi:translation initiation factor eIF-2B subunit epsilon
VIRSDPFVLVSGDVISNMNLKGAIDAHKARRAEVGASCIMTSVLKEAKRGSSTRSLQEDLIVALDRNTKQMVLYDDKPSSGFAALPKEIFLEHSEVEFHYNILDCQVDICSPEVLVQFSDNFDYSDIRRDFVRNEVQNFELGNKIYAHVITDAYAARVHDPRTYHAVARDIVHRWVHPMTPDNNWSLNTTYTYQRRGVYKERDVTLARSCVVADGVVIGSGTTVGEDTTLTRVGTCVSTLALTTVYSHSLHQRVLYSHSPTCIVFTLTNILCTNRIVCIHTHTQW